MADKQMIDAMWDDSPIDVSTEVNFIWSIANKLRGPYRSDKYKDVIIPMVIIRRFECALAPTKQKVVERFKENPNFLVPESRKNEIFNNFIKPGVSDLCVSRTTFDWGIKLPFNKKHVAYVWIDALLNYLSILGYDTDHDKDYQDFWPCDVHIVGRDITRFHAIIWPILLKMMGLPLPKQIH